MLDASVPMQSARMAFAQDADDLLICHGERVRIQVIEGDPPEICATQKLGAATQPTALESVQCHIKVRESMLNPAEEPVP